MTVRSRVGSRLGSSELRGTLGIMPDDAQHHGLDALLPAEMAAKAERIGVAKAEQPATTMFVLGVLAGAFIALGAVFSIVTVTGAGDMPFGVTRLLAGVTFSLGLILVIVAGAELFTGNNLIIMAWAGGGVSTGSLLRNWSIVYVGNFVGSLGVAVLAYAADLQSLDGGGVGETAARIAAAKCELDFVTALSRGVLCNLLVCLAVWISFSARTTTGRILAIVPPIAAFVAAGFEHCIANMFFVPFAMLVQGGFEPVGPGAFVTANLIPVTIGNLIGGTGLVGLVYWFVYLRHRER